MYHSEFTNYFYSKHYLAPFILSIFLGISSFIEVSVTIILFIFLILRILFFFESVSIYQLD